MKLNALMDNYGARADAKRVGRGIGSGMGKTAGRGHKSQRSKGAQRFPQAGDIPGWTDADFASFPEIWI